MVYFPMAFASTTIATEKKKGCWRYQCQHVTYLHNRAAIWADEMKVISGVGSNADVFKLSLVGGHKHLWISNGTNGGLAGGASK